MKLFNSILFLFAVLILTSCGNSTPEWKIKHIEEEPDSTIYVVLNSFTDDTISVTNIETKREQSFSIKEAKVQNKIYGDFEEGDTLAIMPVFKSKSIRSCVNISLLTGLWLFNDNSGNGVLFTNDGNVSPVGNLSNITPRNWKVRNGYFIISYIETIDGEADYTEKLDTTPVTTLTKSTFVFKLNGKTYDCNHVTELITSESQSNETEEVIVTQEDRDKVQKINDRGFRTFKSRK